MTSPIHTAWKDGVWVVQVEGGPVFSRHASRDDAIAAGGELASGQRTTHVIHDADGSVAETRPHDSTFASTAPAA